MKLKISAQVYKLPLRHPFTISRYTIEIQETVIVSITCGDHTGYGEATANPYYGSTVEKIQRSVVSVAQKVKDASRTSPQALWNELSQSLKEDYFALCAIDSAFWDWKSKKRGISLRDLLSVDFKAFKNNSLSLNTSYTIGLASMDKMIEKLRETPWPVYKIKLGGKDDLNVIKFLRSQTSAVFRVDANCAWTANQTVEFAKQMKTLGVEFIEQPLPNHKIESMDRLKLKSVLPLMADESCPRYEDILKCSTGFHAVNIKLMKCGGITPAIKMIQQARELKLKIMLGCMTESGVGIANICQLAPWVDYLDTDGAMLLKNDLAKGVKFVDGRLVYGNISGNGIHTLRQQ
ncbi:dipeptide epimerase [Gangjinia marincola]|uniref:Dipeptide epimerase n=1 Tax=Gangjinia marincola TaxID=578463 RepID=A0ABN1MKL7_9FLAO